MNPRPGSGPSHRAACDTAAEARHLMGRASAAPRRSRRPLAAARGRKSEPLGLLHNRILESNFARSRFQGFGFDRVAAARRGRRQAVVGLPARNMGLTRLNRSIAPPARRFKASVHTFRDRAAADAAVSRHPRSVSRDMKGMVGAGRVFRRERRWDGRAAFVPTQNAKAADRHDRRCTFFENACPNGSPTDDIAVGRISFAILGTRASKAFLTAIVGRGFSLGDATSGHVPRDD